MISAFLPARAINTRSNYTRAGGRGEGLAHVAASAYVYMPHSEPRANAHGNKNEREHTAIASISASDILPSG